MRSFRLVASPANLTFPLSQSAFTFAQRDFSTIDPDLQTPYIVSWNIGLQREVRKDAAMEIRCVGNRGYRLWRAYDLNEVNIFENQFTMTTHYTYGRSSTDRYADSPASRVDYTSLRDPRLNDGPSVYDLRHAFQSYWTYELPFGRDRRFSISNPILNHIAGGWMASGIVRIQSGRPFRLTSGRQTYNNRDAGVVLNGISVNDLQKMVNVRGGPNGSIYFFDERVIGADGRANLDLVAPPTTPGELGQFVYLYGPGFWNVDLGLAKRVAVGGRFSINVEALFLNAFNHPNYLIGNANAEFGSDVNITSTTFGQSTVTAAGPRNVQLRVQINF